MALPVEVAAQSALNTADFEWTILLSCPGDCPPAGVFEAHMKADLAAIEIDKVFSEARGNLARGVADLVGQKIPLTFTARRDEVAGFLGPYTLDLYYLRDGATAPVMRTVFQFEAGA